MSTAEALCLHCLHCGPGRTTTPKMHRASKASGGEASGLGQRGCARGVVLLARPSSCDARHGYARARRRGDAAAAVAVARAQSRRGTAVAAAAVAAPASGPPPSAPPSPLPEALLPEAPEPRGEAAANSGEGLWLERGFPGSADCPGRKEGQLTIP